jgi:hypothetical protein
MWRSSFRASWRSVVALAGREPQAEAPTFSMLGARQGDVTARIVGRRPPAIEVAQAFALELRAEIRAHSRQIAGVALMRRPTPGEHRAISEAAQETARSFVLLHELFHLHGGHVRYVAARSAGSRRPFDEVHLGMTALLRRPKRSGERVGEAEALRAYYLEVEADNSALLCQMQAKPSSAFAVLSP